MLALFVHEDFEIRQSLRSILALDPGHVYGTFGVRMQDNFPVAYGQHTSAIKMVVKLCWPSITDVVQVSFWIAKVCWCIPRYCVSFLNCASMKI